MTDKPIIFSAPMVRALLEGRKTQTRRLLKVRQPHRANKLREGDNAAWFCDGEHLKNQPCEDHAYRIPIYFMPGDRLYVREAIHWTGDLRFVADDAVVDLDRMPDGFTAWRKMVPSIFMPRWASRLTLTVTEVRVQRLQEISVADVRAEGVEILHSVDPKHSFHTLWNSLHGPDAWDENPWVAAISFDVRRGNIDEVPK